MNVISVLRFSVIAATGIAVVAGVEALEVVRMLLVGATRRIAAVVAVARIKRAIDVAVEAGATVIVASSADESATAEPLRAVVPVGCTVIRAVAIISIRAGRTNADADGDLCL